MKLKALALAMSLIPAVTTFATIAEAQTKKCKISVVGGSWAGTTYPLKMVNGEFVGTSGILESPLKGCKAMKYIYGRWYHLCQNSKIIVYKQKDGEWKRLSAKSLKKYKHNCL